MSYAERLKARQSQTGRPVRVGLVGAGQMGRGFVAQVRRIPGMEVVAVADVDLARATGALEAAGVSNTATGTDPDQLAAVIDGGGTVAVSDHSLLAALPLDMVIDATGVPDVGAQVALSSLLAGQHVGLLNVETDVTVGWFLSRVAKQVGKVYTLCRGDEPAEAMKLVEYARDLAFDVVCAGKGKNNPMRPHDTPDDLLEEATRKRMNPKMLCSFVDGSKAMIEMAALANAADLGVAQRGLHAYRTTVPELHEVFKPARDGGILATSGVVDFATGPVAPGVFVVVTTNEPTVLEEMTYLGMGEGPYFSFYRPYHLASVEAPLSVGAAVLDGHTDIAPTAWRAEVAAGAKRDLAVGDVIDGIGATTMYGIIEDATTARDQRLVPLGLLAGARLVRAVRQDQLITYDDVELDTTTTIYHLRCLQDTMLAGAAVPTPAAMNGATNAAAQLASAGVSIT